MDDRRFTEGAEIRMTTDSGKPVFEIQGIVFERWSQDLGGFQETISARALDNTDMSDVVGLFNHDPNYVLGRNKSGTMTLDKRSDSLWAIVTPPDTQWARDLAVSVDRGDISGSSFAFRTAKNGDSWDFNGPIAKRTITSMSLIRDMSVVTYPAYKQTVSKYAMRSAIDAYAEHPDTDLPEELRHHLQKMGLTIPGMDTDEERMKMAAKTGASFDESFLSEMIPHHQMAIDMAKRALSKASHQELKDLAQSIIDTQSPEIAKMEGWQKDWFSEKKSEPLHSFPLSTYQRRARLAELTRAHH